MNLQKISDITAPLGNQIDRLVEENKRFREALKYVAEGLEGEIEIDYCDLADTARRALMQSPDVRSSSDGN